MKEYHKIQTLFKRDPDNNFKTLIDGDYAIPEFDFLQSTLWIFTEKVDGTNIRVHWDGVDIRYGGRTESTQISTSLLNKMLDIIQQRPYREVGGLMREVQIWQAAQSDKQQDESIQDD